MVGYSWWLKVGNWVEVMGDKTTKISGWPIQYARSPDRRHEVRVCLEPTNQGAILDPAKDPRYVECDGETFGPYRRVERLQFSPDSRHWAALAWRESVLKKLVLLVDGAELPLDLPVEMDECAVLVFEAPDRLRLVTAAPKVAEVELCLTVGK
jgi:hypothetical protein